VPNHIGALCTGLIAALKTRLFGPDFLERHRRSEKDFTRHRCLPFHRVVLFLMNLVKRSLQDELDEFFKIESGEDMATREVTKSAFSQARQKLHAGAFIELNTVQVDYFYDHFPYHRWKGLRLLAVDGSTAQLPETPDVVNLFGLFDDSLSLGRVSQMFDVLNDTTVDALIGPMSAGERAYAACHFDEIGTGDLVLLDRGYPAFWLFALIAGQGADFCARMPVGVWGVVDAFVFSGRMEQIIDLSPCASAIKECQVRHLSTAPIKVRLLRIDLDSGEVEVLITSLLDTDRYPYSDFKALYHQRWPVEEDYKVMKSRTEVENWSGQSALSVYQDFHAKVFTKNLTAMLAFPAQEEVKRQSQDKKYTYQINFTQALSKMKDTVVLLFQRADVLPILTRLWELMTRTIEPIRPGRKYPRPKSARHKRFAVTYKPVR